MFSFYFAFNCETVARQNIKDKAIRAIVKIASFGLLDVVAVDISPMEIKRSIDVEKVFILFKFNVTPKHRQRQQHKCGKEF